MLNKNSIEWIQTVKQLEGGYLVNKNMTVPAVDGNRHWEDIKVWLEDNTPEPEFTEAELSKIESDKQIAEAKKYLSDTDWVIVKITEMQLEGIDTTSLMEKYKEELVNRTFYRNLINSLEE